MIRNGRFPRTDSKYARFVKPGIDRLGGLVLTLLSIPIVVMVAVSIRLTMGPGVLFRQERVGRDGQTFRIFKFRTMAHDRRTSDVPIDGPDRRVTHKSIDDPRRTRLGSFLRKWSLDEIPQFWNVLLGQMSLVGPRPELLSVVANYEPWEHDRHLARPGITGLWQVTSRGETLAHEAVAIDIEYLESLSLARDLEIMLRTVPAVLGHRTGI